MCLISNESLPRSLPTCLIQLNKLLKYIFLFLDIRFNLSYIFEYVILCISYVLLYNVSNIPFFRIIVVENLYDNLF